MQVILLASAIILSISETAYFGWNWYPQSTAEFICDTVCIMLVCMAAIAPMFRRG